MRGCVGRFALVGVVLSAAWATPAAGQLRAFGDAEGFGALATGGRSGSIYHVTNLNDSGAGSLRDAVSQSNRIVVFDVGGVITITSPLVFSSNLTVAGQTAPGGIAVYGDGVSLSNRSNVILRHIVFRQGIGSDSDRKALNITSGSNMVLDHVTMAWSRYDNFGITVDSTDITIQNSLSAEAINNQRAGGFIDASRNITLARNLFANNQTRNPKGKADMQFVNNVIYNWRVGGFVGGHSSAPWYQDMIGNYFVAGPSQEGDYLSDFNSNDHVYIAGNKVDDDKDGTLDGRNIDAAKIAAIGATLELSPHNNPAVGVTVMTAEQAYAFAVQQAGSSLTRDSADQRQITHLQSLGKQGYIPADESQVGGMPSRTGGTRPTDTDNDAIPDAWETAHGLNPTVADSLTLDPRGYRMVEAYVNELADQAIDRTWSAASGNWTTAASWTGAVTPGYFEDALVRGTGAANGNVSIASGTATAMRVLIGGNGPAGGESVTVSGSGSLEVVDHIHVGHQNHATLNISGGTVDAWDIILGNTVYSPSAVNYNGTVNLSGGTLKVTNLMLGAGTPGNWNAGGSVNFSGGKIQALGNLLINVPINVSGTGGTIDTNGKDGTLSGTVSGTGGITKQGAGTLTISGNNSMAGGVKVTGGAVAINHLNAAGTGAITLAGGNVSFGSVSGITAPIIVQNSGTLTAGGITLNGAISGGSGVTLGVATTTTGNLTLAGDQSNFLGTFDFGATSGNVRLNALGANGSAAAHYNLGSSTAAIRTAFGATVNLGALSGGANTKLQGATNSSQAVTYVIGGNGSSTTFNGTITNGVFGTPGTTAITKTGNGTLTLTHTGHSFTGATTVAAGRLVVNGAINGSDVTVQSGGTLGGSGSVKSINAAAGSIVAPGASIESLDVIGHATIDGTLQIELNGAGSGSADRLNVGGTLDIGGATVNFTLVPGGQPADDGAYVFASYAALSGTFGTVGSLPAGYVIDYAYNDGTGANHLALVAVAPEPGFAGLVAIPAVLLARRRAKSLKSPRRLGR